MEAVLPSPLWPPHFSLRPRSPTTLYRHPYNETACKAPCKRSTKLVDWLRDCLRVLASSRLNSLAKLHFITTSAGLDCPRASCRPQQ